MSPEAARSDQMAFCSHILPLTASQQVPQEPPSHRHNRHKPPLPQSTLQLPEVCNAGTFKPEGISLHSSLTHFPSLDFFILPFMSIKPLHSHKIMKQRFSQTASYFCQIISFFLDQIPNNKSTVRHQMKLYPTMYSHIQSLLHYLLIFQFCIIFLLHHHKSFIFKMKSVTLFHQSPLETFHHICSIT